MGFIVIILVDFSIRVHLKSFLKADIKKTKLEPTNLTTISNK